MATSHLMRNSTFVYTGLRHAEVNIAAYGSRRGPVAPRPASQPASPPASQPASQPGQMGWKVGTATRPSHRPSQQSSGPPTAIGFLRSRWPHKVGVSCRRNATFIQNLSFRVDETHHGKIGDSSSLAR